ncbi:hypothetical protein F5Y09DRAFT_278634 [Xylaria sp. FL1042]|nr:hypothetical protein F5Y09DRAFT_278634 [Xylaria sp. FL1042]
MPTNTVSWITRPVVSQYDLPRSDFPTERIETEFMEPYVGNVVWSGFHIRPDSDMYYSYAVSRRSNAYVIISVTLTRGDHIGAPRLTEMRHHDMMVDNYIDANGDLRTWRYIGVNEIVNDPTRIVIEKCFSNRGVDTRVPGLVELVPHNSDFSCVTAQNPFTRGILRLLRKYETEMGKARMRRVIFISEGLVEGLEAKFHLVVELCRPGEDGYPTDEVWNQVC